jgi:hypothetical protein
MANQITIDIVAQTNKLTSGINDANGQIDGMSTKLKGIAGAAGLAASGFLATQGLTFLKQGIDEAKEAQETMRAATTTFGEGSAALAKITEDADKFGKALAVDNDELIALATQLGSRLPKDVQASSVELVKIFKDVEAFTGGAVSAEAAGNKLAKAFADGEIKAAELTKVFPGLEQSVYDQAEALSKAGDNQGALNLLISEGSIKYDDAAAKNATSTQKFEVALANFKEELGGKVLPILEKGIDFLTQLFTAFDNLPGPVQNIVIGLGALLITGALTLTFLASMKASLVTLGITSTGTAGSIGLATIATNLLKIALAGLGIGLVIAAIVLLVQNWDKVTAAVDKVWEKIKDVVPKAWAKVMEFKDKVVGFVGNIVSAYLSIPGKMLEVGKDIVEGLWKGMSAMVGWLKDKVSDLFGNVTGWAKKALGIKSPSKVFGGIGKNIAQGLWTGLNKEKSYLKNNFADFFGEIIPNLTTDALNLPDFAQFATKAFVNDSVSNSSADNALLAGVGLDWNSASEQFDIDSTVVTTAKLSELLNSNFSIPSINENAASVAPYNITINAGTGTDPYSVGRAVTSAIEKYARISALPDQRLTL